VGEDRAVVGAVLGVTVGAVLAHADPVAVSAAADVEQAGRASAGHGLKAARHRHEAYQQAPSTT
jgi:hypothetical protein